MTVGERIKFLRKQINMTLEDVATAIGVKRPTVFKYETGAVTNIPPDKIEELAKVFGVTPQYLMGWTDERTDSTEHTNQPQSYFKTPEARIIARAIDQMPTDRRQQALSLIRIAFPEYAHLFTVEEDDLK